MIAALSFVLAATVVAMIVIIALTGWGGPLHCARRVGLTMVGAGLLWAGPGRFAGQPPGLGDLLMLSGLVLHLGAVYGPRLWQRVDRLDGRPDGRLRLRRPF